MYMYVYMFKSYSSPYSSIYLFISCLSLWLFYNLFNLKAQDQADPGLRPNQTDARPPKAAGGGVASACASSQRLTMAVVCGGKIQTLYRQRKYHNLASLKYVHAIYTSFIMNKENNHNLKNIMNIVAEKSHNYQLIVFALRPCYQEEKKIFPFACSYFGNSTTRMHNQSRVPCGKANNETNGFYSPTYSMNKIPWIYIFFSLCRGS